MVGKKLASLITEFEPSIISQAARGKVSDLVIDVVGAAAAGARTDAAAATRAVCERRFSSAWHCAGSPTGGFHQAPQRLQRARLQLRSTSMMDTGEQSGIRVRPSFRP